MTQKELRERARVSFAKVAEYQKRGVVHFHAVIRLDGPNGPDTSPPPWATADLLTRAIILAAGNANVTTPCTASIASRTLRWGAQLDIRPVKIGGELTDNAVAGYIAKYATKAAECTGTLDRRITRADNLDTLPVTPHARRLIAECLRIGQVPELAHLRTAHWAHMLGFRGHFSTKSRAYSTTLGKLRAARADHARAQHADNLPTAKPCSSSPTGDSSASATGLARNSPGGGVTTSTDVKLWEVRRNKSSKKPSWEVRWVVGGHEVSRSRGTKALAESLLSELRQAMKRGESFDVQTGLPESMLRAKNGRTWFAFVLEYVDSAGLVRRRTRARACLKRSAA